MFSNRQANTNRLVSVAQLQSDCCYLKLSLQFSHFFLQFSILLLQSFGLCSKVQGLTEEDRCFRVGCSLLILGG